MLYLTYFTEGAQGMVNTEGIRLTTLARCAG